jgi:DNA-binding beta-propeller fold protein YncE
MNRPPSMPSPRSCPRPLLKCVLLIPGLPLLLGVGSTALAQDDQADKAIKQYSLAISQANADLNAGKVSQARQQLEATDTALRSIEYEYLVARANTEVVDGAARNLIRTIATPEVGTRYGVLNEVDRQLAFICRDGIVRIHDLKTPEAQPKTAAHEGGAIWSGAFSRDGTVFVAGHENGDVAVWDVKTWKLRHAVSLGEKWPVRELAVAPDGSAFVAESKTALELWSLADTEPQKVAAVGERYNFGEGLAFSPQGDLIATGGMFDIVLHNAKTGEATNSMQHASYTMGLEFSPDGKRIASAPRGNINKFLAVFDVADGKLLFNAGPFQNYVAGLAFTPDGKRVVATGPQKNVRLFDAASGEVVLSISRSNHTAKPAVSRDGRLLGWNEPSGYHYIVLANNSDAD